MRIRLYKIGKACVLALTAFAVTAGALAQNQGGEDVRVDVNLKNADLVEATRMLTQQTGLQFVFEPSAEPYEKVTCRFEKILASEALEYICKAAGAYFVRDTNGVYIIKRKKEGAGNVAIVPPPVTPPQPKQVKKLAVLKADVYDVFCFITRGEGWNPMRGWNILNDHKQRTRAESVQFAGGKPQMLGSDSPTQFKPYDSQTIGAGNGTGITLPGEESGSAGQRGPGGGGGGLGGLSGGQGGLGGLGGGGGLGGLGGGQGGLGGLGGGQGNLTGGQGLVGQSIDFISFDPTDNSIVVRGNEEDIANLQRYITMFDVAPKQVTVKVEFITTSSSDSRALGFDWLYERGNVFTGTRPGTFARAGDPIFLNWATGNVQARMRALLQTGRGKVVQSPIVRTLNNQPASVFSTIQTWIFLTQVVATQGGTVITVPQPVQIPIQTGLTVAPRINDDGTITMFLQPQVTDLGQIRRGPDGTEIPDVLSQVISVVARVKNGETIALGGLTRKTDTGSEARIPILGDLPIVGQFFRSRNNSKDHQELIIFVTPTIVEEDEGRIG